mmetsp:Transcript_27884/g.44370  ORF Transcript_27884/g.44370 Transcript_27884/m.44370 type:complete len:655 (-) Transcript_27884:157-2121(-)
MSNWKLAGEIERLLKRVVEGIADFDTTWEKVHNAPSANLKEKYEAELKKEIKKLQRYRDQIKTWVASSDVKNKSQLMDSRKAIEREMERFKVLERESKTKAYSKEGLAKLNKIRKVDPRQESYEWIAGIKEKLNEQIEELEEQVNSAPAKKRGKHTKRMVSELDERIKRHQWHIDHLNSVKSRLEGKEITIKQAKRIREDVEWYVESNQEPDFVVDEFLYDAIDDEDSDKEEKEENVEESEEEEPKPSPKPKPSPPKLKRKASKKDSKPKEKKSFTEKKGPTSKKHSATSPAAVTPPKSSKTPSKPTNKKTLEKVGLPRSQSSGSSQKAIPEPKVQPPKSAWSQPQSVPKTAIVTQMQKPPPPADAKVTRPPTGLAQPGTGTRASSVPNWGPKPKPTAPNVWGGTGAGTGTPTNTPPLAANVDPAAPANKGAWQQTLRRSQSDTTAASAAPISTPPGGAPIGPRSFTPSTTASDAIRQLNRKETNYLSARPFSESAPSRSRFIAPGDEKVYHGNLRLLSTSMRKMPQTTDTDRPKQYIPRNPYHTPQSFPKIPPPVFDSPGIFRRFSTDTLFFIFYFQQGTQHQYYAARELKRQSWRYHKNFLTWFQRHNAPKFTNDTCERGTYVYFDYENGWGKRVKQDFTFEYSNLEDELRV